MDLAALRANAAAMTGRAAGKPIRLASKSVRSRPLVERALGMPGFRGVLAYTLPEALWLHASGTSDNIVVAYPTADRTALARLAGDPAAAAAISVMVDCADHLDMIEKAAAGADHAQPVRVGMDLDAGFVTLGGRFRAGARRSPVRTPAQAADLAAAIVARPGLRLAGLMAYEAQIAGVGDNPPGRPLYARAVRMMQRMSAAELAGRRAAIVAAVRQVAPVEFVNGGGTGSLERTAAEPAVTELGAGLRAVPAAAVRQLPDLLRPARRAVRAAGSAAAGPRRDHRAGRRLPGLRPGQREPRCRPRTCRPG